MYKPSGGSPGLVQRVEGASLRTNLFTPPSYTLAMARPADIAKRAAAAYYGLSSDDKRIPKAWDIEYLRQHSLIAKETPFLVRLNDLVVSKWSDNIGSVSRTARMSDLDFLVYANDLLEKGNLPIVKPGDERVIQWMAYVAAQDDALLLLRLSHGKTEKLLLVNTSITQ
jgi:hypothetical protein